VLLRLFHDHRDAPQKAADRLRTEFRTGRLLLVLLDLSIYEFVNILTRRLKKPLADVERATSAVFRLGSPLVRIDEDLARSAGRIAAHTGLSGYDAAFVAAARSLAIPLITADTQVIRAAAGDVLGLDELPT
jgi:predicted nucleic acid-binding protein